MFATLRNSNDSLDLERSGTSIVHAACNYCRAKKLKCSGEQQGCRRCLSLRIKCEYGTSSSGKRTRQADHLSDPRNAVRRSIQRQQSQQPPANVAALEPRTPTTDGYNDSEHQSVLRSLQLSDDEHSKLPWLRDGAEIPSTEMPDSACDLDALLAEGDAAKSTDIALHELDHDEPFQEKDFLLGSAGNHSSTTESCGCPLPSKDAQFSGNIHGSDHGFLFPRSLEHTRTRPTNSKASIHKAVPDPPSSNMFNTLTQVNRTPPIESMNQSSCSCVESALTALEALELEAEPTKCDTIDQSLRLKKQTLVRCAEILSCENCNASSRYLVLLILLCQKVAGSYERLIRTLNDHFTKDDCLKVIGLSPYSITQAHDAVTGLGRKNGALFLREYETDAAEELCIYKGLIALQLGKWRMLLSHVKKQCSILDLDRHSAMVLAVDRTVEAQLRTCRAQ